VHNVGVIVRIAELNVERRGLAKGIGRLRAFGCGLRQEVILREEERPVEIGKRRI
jgi:hypothetical protein